MNTPRTLLVSLFVTLSLAACASAPAPSPTPPPSEPAPIATPATPAAESAPAPPPPEATAATAEPAPKAATTKEPTKPKLAAEPKAAAYTGPAPCKLATKGSSPVAKACAEGGQKKAKQVMKDMVKQGKAAGVKFDCDACHSDDGDPTQLTSDAKDKMAKLLAAIKG